MSAEGILKQSEMNALKGSNFVTNVNGKNNKLKSKNKRKWRSLGATAILTGIIVIAVILFSSGNIIPSGISERLIEETDVQYADAVASKAIILQNLLKEGSVPKDTAEILKRKGVLVGYEENGKFVESNQHEGWLMLKMNNRTINSEDFYNETMNNWELYDAFDKATYSRAAYYYDESANEVFKKYNTSRNNYNGTNSFENVVNSLLGEGSDIDVNTVALVEKTRKNEQTGETEVYYEYEARGDNAKSGSKAATFISDVGEKNVASTEDEATMYSADQLSVADTISKEQRSGSLFLAFMENISKMKAGEGNTSSINDAMNFLYDNNTTMVEDTKTGEVIKLTGAPVDSPSLYAILSGEKVDIDKAKNFSSDRINDLIKNKLGKSGVRVEGTVASTTSKVKGTIGRYVNNGTSSANLEILKSAEPIINSSLVDNSYETIKGIDAGEMLVDGAVNIGKELAKKSGGAAGDAAAVVSYLKLNSEIARMEAKIDRMNRNPFDITSKNTFLGSIVHSFAFSSNYSGVRNITTGLNGVLKSVGVAVINLMPRSFADSAEGYLSNFGDCERYNSINAVGSVGCSEIATFDASTLNNPYSDPGFIAFIENNTSIDSSGKRIINKGSDLADYILYNDERITPLGVVDGGIIESKKQNSSTISLESDISKMVEDFMGVSNEERWFAKGGDFVNSSSNPKWQTYKYAQRYISLARAAENLKMYSNDKTAYNNLHYFEGYENPVMAFTRDYYEVANR